MDLFEVRAKFDFDDDFAAKDDRVYEIVYETLGCHPPSHWSGTDFGQRDHGWRVETFDDALELRRKLAELPWMNSVLIREV